MDCPELRAPFCSKPGPERSRDLQSSTCHSHCCPDPSPGWLHAPGAGPASPGSSLLTPQDLTHCAHQLLSAPSYHSSALCLHINLSLPSLAPHNSLPNLQSHSVTPHPSHTPSVALTSLRAKFELLSAILRPCSLISHHSPLPAASAVSSTHRGVPVSRPLLRLSPLPLGPVSLPKLRLPLVSFYPFLRIQLRPPPPGSLRG